LDQIRIEAINQRGRSQDADSGLWQYLNWARTAADRLRTLISADDIRRLIQTPTYWALLTVVSARGGVFPTVIAELDSVAAALEGAVTGLRADRERWQAGFGGLVVLDTTVFLEHSKMFPELLASVEQEVAPKADSRFAGGDPIQFVIPLLVVDEFDRAKADRVRHRARVALAALDQIFTSPSAAVEHVSLRQGSRLHLLLDELDHARLPDPDNEIVDRALHVRAAAGAVVGIATFDTGMALRTRAAGLTSYHLRDHRPDQRAPGREPAQ